MAVIGVKELNPSKLYRNSKFIGPIISRCNETFMRVKIVSKPALDDTDHCMYLLRSIVEVDQLKDEKFPPTSV